VGECGLTPISVANVSGVHGSQQSNVYLIDVYLPNHVVVQGVEAVESRSLAGEADDVLIGMDIIGLGDFAVSNFQGKTTFTFRIPSLAEIDFVPPPIPKVGRNQPCPCGSGKKYKKCHGGGETGGQEESRATHDWATSPILMPHAPAVRVVDLRDCPDSSRQHRLVPGNHERDTEALHEAGLSTTPPSPSRAMARFGRMAGFSSSSSATVTVARAASPTV
jgi:hypothetical protein